MLHCLPGYAADSLPAPGSGVATAAERRNAQPAGPAGEAIAQHGELLLVIDVNGQKFDEPVVVLQDRQGRLHVAAGDLRNWRLHLPATAPLRQQDVDYFALDGYDGLQYTFNQARQTLTLMAEPRLFLASAVAVLARMAATPSPSQAGGFFNYDLLGTRSSSGTQRSGQFELGIFNGNGVGTLGIVAPELGAGSRPVRLDTTWSMDEPKERQSWRLGDVINRAGAWGRSVRMGGVQFGTNFSTQPGFISFPVQQAAGLASLPSTVDVYVNNALASRREVPPGPFSITNLPVVSGSGEVRMVVRDMLGREQVITQPFYSSAGLLAEGLQDYSYEFGFARENFGINSNDYGDWAGVATHRWGFSDRFTGEARIEAQNRVKAAGISGLYLLPPVGIFNAALAGSQASAAGGGSTSGALAALGFERQAQPVNFAMHAQWASRDFRQLGLEPGQSAPARQLSANAGYATQSMGSLGVSYLRQDARDQPSIGIAGASYSLSLQRYGTLTVSAIRSTGSEKTTQMSLIWTLPLGANHSTSATRNSTRSSTQGNARELIFTAQKNLPVGEGHGYQIEARESGDLRGAATYQNNVATFTAEAASVQGESAMRAGIRGGVALVGGQPYLSRWISESFGLARVPGFADVRVYADNHLVGQTDAAGDAMLPRLRAYERNRIRIEPRDLPLDADVDTLRVEAVPYFRSGVVAEFPVRRSRGALFRVLLDDGQPLPAGTTVERRGGKSIFPVANDGEVYVTGLEAQNRMIARWKNQACEFDLKFEPTADPLPDLGSHLCKGIAP